MTNGEKFKQIFPNYQIDMGELYVYVWLPNHDAVDIPHEWWDAEYREPTIRNCFGCKYSKDNHNASTEECHLCMWENQYTPTANNDLGVDCIVDVLGSYTDLDIPYKREIAENILTKLSSVTPQLSSGLEKNSKKLEKNFGELDCISRAQAQTEIEMNAFRYTLAKERGGVGEVEWNSHLIDINDAVDIIRNLPSVTPQEPRCKDCKWWKDSDGEYRRGVGAESQCPINRKEVYEGNGYCFLYEPQESEDKE